MKKIILLITFFSFNAYSFTLYDKGHVFNKSKININIAATSCSGAGFTTAQLSSMVTEAIEDYWNAVPTSSLVLKNNGVGSIDIDGDSFSSAMTKASMGTILAGCNDDISDFSSPGILGAAVMDCSGSDCKAVLIMNANNSYLNNMSRAQRVATIAHEIGHAFGLGHSEFTHNLMYYSASGKKQQWLGEDDIDGVSYLYPHDAQIGGLLGSCATISTNKDDKNFSLSLLIGLLLSFIVGLKGKFKLGYCHFLDKFSKKRRAKL
jgi:hypothetical protein